MLIRGLRDIETQRYERYRGKDRHRHSEGQHSDDEQVAMSTFFLFVCLCVACGACLCACGVWQGGACPWTAETESRRAYCTFNRKRERQKKGIYTKSKSCFHGPQMLTTEPKAACEAVGPKLSSIGKHPSIDPRPLSLRRPRVLLGTQNECATTNQYVNMFTSKQHIQHTATKQRCMQRQKGPFHYSPRICWQAFSL